MPFSKKKKAAAPEPEPEPEPKMHRFTFVILIVVLVLTLLPFIALAFGIRTDRDNETVVLFFEAVWNTLALGFKAIVKGYMAYCDIIYNIMMQNVYLVEWALGVSLW